MPSQVARPHGWVCAQRRIHCVMENMCSSPRSFPVFTVLFFYYGGVTLTRDGRKSRLTMLILRRIRRLIPAGTLFLCAVSILQSYSVRAAEFEDPVRCASISDDRVRLVCYDAIFQNKVETSKDTPASAASPIAPTHSGVRDFGSEHLKQPKPDKSPSQSQAIEAIVIRLSKGIRKEWLFHLNNGQLWKQRSDRYIRIKEGEKVIIRRGRLGGYTLITPGGMSTKVIRLN